MAEEKIIAVLGAMGAQIAKSFFKIHGEEVDYMSSSFDDYRNFGFPGTDEMGNMFQFKHDFEQQYCGARDLELTRKLNSELIDFDTWLKINI